MIDFSKKIPGASRSKQVNPIDLYDDLDRQATAGPLRPTQAAVLDEWFKNRFEDRDVIVKLHTGEGKTLIGLLMLQSRLNAGKGPAIYVCPTIQLAEQTALDAVKFGVLHILDRGGTDVPEEVLEGKKIWITYIQRVFNGRTIFGLDTNGKLLGTMVIDDSHACIDSIRNATSIKIPRIHPMFQTILSIFESDLKQQGEGTYLDIKGNDYSTEVLPIPYWAWMNNTEEIVQLFHENADQEPIHFVYPLIKDILSDCTAYVSSMGIEIVANYSLIHRFLFFVNCRQRIFMSATTQDDSFFIKGFGLTKETILNPLVDKTKKWSGEKMILFPTRVDEILSLETMRKYLFQTGVNGAVKCVALVPSRRIGEEYKILGATVATKDNMKGELEYLRSAENTNPHAVVFVNRYDGIDLADNQCRILMIDSKPSMGPLSDKYEEACREDSDIVSTKVAQKIEQGLGRSVRSEKDYSVIMMVGEDLVRFVKSSQNQRFFSAQTRQQIKIAEEMLQMLIGEAKSDRVKAFVDLVNQCIQRNDSWKQYYHQSMETMEENADEHPYLSIIEQEEKAETHIRMRQYNEACAIYQNIANSYSGKPFERGWYLQKAAQCKYKVSKLDGMSLQAIAHRCNLYLLKPEEVRYEPIQQVNQIAATLALNYIRKHNKHEDLHLTIDALLRNLSFGVSASKFEAALHEIGQLLGYICQRPDQTFKVGPDNLWMEPATRQFFAIECKNEVLLTRDAINKEEVGQMNNHIAWFEENYPTDPHVAYIHVHSTNKVSNQANYNKEVRIMTPDKLDAFKKNIRGYVVELANYKMVSLTESVITEALKAYRLLPSDIVLQYTVKAERQV